MIGLAPRVAAADDPAPRSQIDPPAPPQPSLRLPACAPPSCGPPGNGPPGCTRAYGAPIDDPEEITDFDSNAPIPSGYTKVTRARRGPIIGGAVTLGSAYLATAFGAAVAGFFGDLVGSRTDYTPLFIPVVGPFVEMGQSNRSSDQFSLVVSGLAQTTGLILLVYGLNSRRTVLVRNDRLTVPSIAPLIGPGASGLSVVGRF
jgi:hypothetical protein